jgi:hypothetical protein
METFILKTKLGGRQSIVQGTSTTNYFSLVYKYLAPGNRVAEKEGFIFGLFKWS